MAKAKNTIPEFIRPGIAPGLAGVITMFIGMAVYVSEWYITVMFLISIFGAIMTVFAWQSIQSKKWFFVPAFGAIVVFWNPIFPLVLGFDATAQWWLLVQTAAAAIFFLGAFWIKTPAPPR